MALKQSKKKRPRREDKIDKIRWPLEEGVFDRDSLLTLEKFMKKNIFYTLDYCIAKGKEANIYRGTTKEGGYVAVKMYRLRSPSFLHMQQYIEGDRRFNRGSKGQFGTVFTWTRKEYANLKLMQEAGIRAPKPIAFKHNVLAMEFLGENGVPYSKLVEVGSEQPEKDYQLILDDLKKLYSAGLVHSDVSEFNILMTDKGPYLIDCGQAVLTTHPQAAEFYARDLQNLKNYFSKFIDIK